MLYADIIVDISSKNLDKIFQYGVPPDLEDQVCVGMVVNVPFGKSDREVAGYVVGLTADPSWEAGKIKMIRSCRNSAETTESRLILLAVWMKSRYGSTMAQALRTVFPIKARMDAKEKKIIVLRASREKAEEFRGLWQKKNYRARIRLLEHMIQQGQADQGETLRLLGIGRNVVEALEKEGLVQVVSREQMRNPVDLPADARREVVLSVQQEQAVEEICQEWAGADRPCLLHGVTGSGKTQVYMELMGRTLRQGRQAIVLIPEISLTYQLVMGFYGRFGDQVSVIHSRLSQGEKYDQMKRAKAGEISIMIGPRSALFTPFPRLGLIVLDEEQEQAYKSEQAPRYHAREVAIHRGQLEGAHVVFGSATPSLATYYKCQRGEYRKCVLDSRYRQRPMPQVSIVDMREEIRAGNRSILSRKLQQEMEQRLEKREQVMLFLNRRGYLGFITCRSCGYVLKCPHCDVSLTDHNDGTSVCHYCGHTQRQQKTCPICGSSYIGGFHAGTQQIEEVVKKRFPASRILRMDHDTTRGKKGHWEILRAFQEREADILVGTQMIVKGHDMPGVTLVGALAADMSLFAADHASGERTFQLLTQAVGRSGRGETAGSAVIQTYQPEHYSITCAARQDYEGFYREEIGYRELMGYPPVSGMMGILGFGHDERQLDRAMGFIRQFISRLGAGRDAQVIGPTALAVGKVQDVYRRVIYVKEKEEDRLRKLKDQVEAYVQINEGFRGLQIQFDFHI